jgi:alpha-L-fucosidase
MQSLQTVGVSGPRLLSKASCADRIFNQTPTSKTQDIGKRGARGCTAGATCTSDARSGHSKRKQCELTAAPAFPRWLDDHELKILDEITRWMAINGEGIYATRPWKILGDGPVATAPPASGRGPRFNEAGRRDLTADEVRFTTKSHTLYAFVMGWPEKQAVIKPLATNSSVAQVKVRNVGLLGLKGKLQWTQDERRLTIQMPEQKPCDHAIGLKIAI